VTSPAAPVPCVSQTEREVLQLPALRSGQTSELLYPLGPPILGERQVPLKVNLISVVSQWLSLVLLFSVFAFRF